MREAPDFFNVASIEFASEYRGKLYSSHQKDLKRAGQIIQKDLVEKVKFWVDNLNPPGFDQRHYGRWLQYRYFADYAWAQIYKQSHKTLGIYFTVGVDFKRKALVYKLDCQSNAPRRKAKNKILLTEDQIKHFRELVDETGAEWQQINLEEIESFNWSRLLEETDTFIKQYEWLYDKVIRVLYQSRRSKAKLKMELEKTSAPTRHEFSRRGSKVPPGLNPVDVQEADRRNTIGAAGETLVLENERKYLRKCGKSRLADQVQQVSVSEGPEAGYDILSYDQQGNKRYIEVKSTVGTALQGFYLTSNELQFSRANPDRYVIYRLYDLDLESMSAKYFELPGDAGKSCKLIPITFSAAPTDYPFIENDKV